MSIFKAQLEQIVTADCFRARFIRLIDYLTVRILGTSQEIWNSINTSGLDVLDCTLNTEPVRLAFFFSNDNYNHLEIQYFTILLFNILPFYCSTFCQFLVQRFIRSWVQYFTNSWLTNSRLWFSQGTKCWNKLSLFYRGNILGPMYWWTVEPNF